MAAALLTSKWQMVLPKAVRDFLKVHPGDRLDFVVRPNGDVVVRPANLSIDQLDGMLAKPGRRAVSVEEMNGALSPGPRGLFRLLDRRDRKKVWL